MFAVFAVFKVFKVFKGNVRREPPTAAAAGAKGSTDSLAIPPTRAPLPALPPTRETNLEFFSTASLAWQSV